MGFGEIIGHPAAVRALQRSLAEDQLAGTYLIVGPQGVGKTTLALALAQAAACLGPTRDPFDACGTCESCRRAESAAQPEIVLISPAGDQTQIWQFWDRDGRPPGALQHTLPFAPAIGRRRVYIVERADTLNEAAANSLLKALEEPPPYALFVLLAPHTARLLPTILSRAQLVRLAPMPVDEAAAHLAGSLGIESERARTLAACAEGRIGTALALARAPGFETEMEYLLDFAETIPDASPLQALRVAESMRKLASGMKALTADDPGASAAQRADIPEAPDVSDIPGGGPAPRERLGRRQLGSLVEWLAAYYRDVLAIRLGGPEAQIAFTRRRERLAAVAAGAGPHAWTACLDALLAARRQIDQNVNPRLVTEALAIKLVVGVRDPALRVGP